MPSSASCDTDWREHWRTAGANDYFDDFAEPLLELAVRHLAPDGARGGRLLDVGCGHGRNAELFRRLGMDVAGIDVDEPALSAARQRYPQIDFQTGDVQNLAFPDATFDAVFSASVLQYVDWPRAIRECRRVLKPGGKAVFIENLRGNPMAIGYRLLHRLSGWRYGEYQTPREHIDWKELGEFGQVYSAVEIHPLHLATPLVLVWPLLRSKVLHRPFQMRTKRLFRALRRFDQSMLHHFARLKRRCWLVVIEVTK
jgi:SAM-dependent methyltransferase